MKFTMTTHGCILWWDDKMGLLITCEEWEKAGLKKLKRGLQGVLLGARPKEAA